MAPGRDEAARSILCGVDDSPDARLALRVAARLARRLEARLLVVHVAGGSEEELEAGARLLARLAEEERVDDAELRAVEGFPPDRLADAADEEGAELIVVGSRGRGAFRAAFLGSVSMDLIGVARCPVLVVPPGLAAAPAEAPPVATRRAAA